MAGTGSGRNYAAKHSYGRRFSGTIRAQKAENLPLFNFEVNFIHRDKLAEFFFQVRDAYGYIHSVVLGGRCLSVCLR